MVRDLLRTWGPAILAVILIRTFVFEPYRIPSGSMVPTLLIGDHVLVSKFAYGIWLPFVNTQILDLGFPERGDIVVFRYPRNPRLTYIKRVVAVPGDEIAVRNNRIYLDGELQMVEPVGGYDFVDDACRVTPTEKFHEHMGGNVHSVLTSSVGGKFLANRGAVRVPEGQVFVMGDNRDHSEDSRRWGFVREDEIKGKAHFVWFSWNACEGRPGSIRVDRFFHRLYRSAS